MIDADDDPDVAVVVDRPDASIDGIPVEDGERTVADNEWIQYLQVESGVSKG